MARVLHAMPIGSLPEPGELETNDQIIAYRSDTGEAYRSDIKSIGGLTLDDVYPVGSIYMSINAVDPGNLFGGHWEQIMDRFLLAAGNGYAAGTQGGDTSVTLASSNIPSHTHSIPSHTHSIPSLSGIAASAGNHTHGMYYYQNYTQSGTNQSMYYTSGDHTSGGSVTMASAGAHTHSVTTNSSITGSTSGTSGSTGSGSAFDIMPPYLAVYVWQRIS